MDMLTIFLLFQMTTGGDVLEVDAFTSKGACMTAMANGEEYYAQARRAKPDFVAPAMECVETQVPKPAMPGQPA